MWKNTSASTNEGIWFFNGPGVWAVGLVTDRYYGSVIIRLLAVK